MENLALLTKESYHGYIISSLPHGQEAHQPCSVEYTTATYATKLNQSVHTISILVTIWCKINKVLPSALIFYCLPFGKNYQNNLRHVSTKSGWNSLYAKIFEFVLFIFDSMSTLSVSSKVPLLIQG